MNLKKPINIRNTNLQVTDVLYQESQTSLFRDGRAQVATLLLIQDTITKETGHLYHEVETDKRDIMDENFYTDNPRLFRLGGENNPEASGITELSSCGEPSTPTERNDQIDEIIATCTENQLTYREGNPDGKSYEEKKWGLCIDGGPDFSEDAEDE